MEFLRKKSGKLCEHRSVLIYKSNLNSTAFRYDTQIEIVLHKKMYIVYENNMDKLYLE